MTIAKATGKQKLISFSLLVLICNFALAVALFGIPAISESSGVAREYATYGLAGLAFVVALVATRWAKTLNKKKNLE